MPNISLSGRLPAIRSDIQMVWIWMLGLQIPTVVQLNKGPLFRSCDWKSQKCKLKLTLLKPVCRLTLPSTVTFLWFGASRPSVEVDIRFGCPLRNKNFFTVQNCPAFWETSSNTKGNNRLYFQSLVFKWRQLNNPLHNIFCFVLIFFCRVMVTS